jgi:prepilin peptidase CpaA
MTRELAWILTVFFAVWAGILDLRYRRIPNWLTGTALVCGIAVNAVLGGWTGARTSLLGAALGLLILLPFVLLRALGGGDWKLVGALGGLLGPAGLLDVLMVAVLVAGIMAVILVIAKGRGRETLRNLGHLIGSLLTFQRPGMEVSLDNPRAAKVPFGVAVAIAVLLYAAEHAWRLAGQS